MATVNLSLKNTQVQPEDFYWQTYYQKTATKAGGRGTGNGYKPSVGSSEPEAQSRGGNSWCGETPLATKAPSPFAGPWGHRNSEDQAPDNACGKTGYRSDSAIGKFGTTASANRQALRTGSHE